MLEFLVDIYFVVFAGKVFQQTIGIPIGTHCAPLLADIFLYSYGADFIVFALNGKETFSISVQSHRYIDNVLSINNSEFENYLGQMYPVELEIKDTTERTTFVSSNIPSSPAYGVFISQPIRYARACSSYECLTLRAWRLSSKLLKQGHLMERLKSSFRKFYCRYVDLILQHEVSLSRMLIETQTLDQQIRLSTNS